MQFSNVKAYCYIPHTKAEKCNNKLSHIMQMVKNKILFENRFDLRHLTQVLR